MGYDWKYKDFLDWCDKRDGLPLIQRVLATGMRIAAGAGDRRESMLVTFSTAIFLGQWAANK